MNKSSDEQRATSNEPTQHSEPFPQSYPPDPRLLAAMYGMQEEDEIDLLEYWRVIWGKRNLILSVVFAVAILAAGISLRMPNIYRAGVLLAPVVAEGSKSGGLSSALGGLGGLASMAGISLGGGGGSVEENLAVLKSREFLWQFIKDQKLMPVLFADAWDADKKVWKKSNPDEQPGLWDAYRTLTGILNASTDKKSNLVTVSIDWKSPELAAQWANLLVSRLNEFLRQQAISRSNGNLQYLKHELSRTQVANMRQALFELISQEQKKAMLANTQKEFAFQVIDKAVAPDRKSKPKRSLIVILSAFVAGFLAVIFVFIREGIRRREEEDTHNDQP